MSTQSKTSAVATPALNTGTLAVLSKTFWELGGYDEGMDYWGGESLELSWRTWMCGGSVRISPCSRVGHMFRPVHAYSFGEHSAADVLRRNTNRAVLVWADRFVGFFQLFGGMRCKDAFRNCAQGNTSF